MNEKKMIIVGFIMVVIGLFILSGCTEKEYPPHIQSQIDESKIVSKIHYIKDKNTGLCFAYINSYTYGIDKIVTSITNVPCSNIEGEK